MSGAALLLAVGLFTGAVWRCLEKERQALRRRSGISRTLSAVLAVLVLTAALGGQAIWPASASAETGGAAAESGDDTAPDFTLRDQYGQEHTLSAYRGKVVFLNFWTTWCPWCIQEMPEIEEIYHELGENQGDVVILGVAAPDSYDTVDEQGIIDFLAEHGWTYPVVMDSTGKYFNAYGAQSLPTTWLIRADGKLMGYIPGAMDKPAMLDVIQQTLDAGQ